ncbi:MAG TPA: hypothetical protein VGA92_00685 [Candidatus Nitrosotenuis sp.]|jgi:hypothetical protein
MSNISNINADEAEIVRIISRLPEFAWLESADLSKIRSEIRHEIAKILGEYFAEKTRNTKPNWTIKFKEAGISEDDGKTAISCARRLGIEIS